MDLPQKRLGLGASFYYRLLEHLAALARPLQPYGVPSCYQGSMADSFVAYQHDLDRRDLDPKTHLRWCSCLGPIKLARG